MANYLTIDRAACAGHGLCYGAAPEILDCDDQGDPVLLVNPISEDRMERARHVINICPERALGLSPQAEHAEV
jgi:ferredoxin